jgi:type IV pilus assembly protein PilO
MVEIKNLRKRATALLIVLLLMDATSIVVLLSPLGRSRSDDIQQLQTQLKLKTQQVLPLRGLDSKVLEAKQEITEFYRNRLPAEYSSIGGELGKLVSENGTRIAQVKYHPEDPEPGGLRPVTIESLLSGDYVHVMKFINALERDRMFFIVDSVALGDSQGGTVKLQLKMQTYLKTGA